MTEGVGITLEAPSGAPLRWQCGHTINDHTREQAIACYASQHRYDSLTITSAGAVVNTDTATCAAILAEAARITSGDRAATHGDKTLNHAIIAQLWNAYLQVVPRTALRADDVATMMELLKIARRLTGAFNSDDYIDAAGYAGIAGEIAHQCQRDSQTQSPNGAASATASAPPAKQSPPNAAPR